MDQVADLEGQGPYESLQMVLCGHLEDPSDVSQEIGVHNALQDLPLLLIGVR